MQLDVLSSCRINNEADDLYRERQRHHLGEPCRTLVGHFRHELGHYYWDRFFQRVLLTTSQSVPIPFTPLLPEQVVADTPHADVSFLSTLNDWAKLSPALNEMATSLGHATMYLFIFTPQTARKILFIHHMVKVAAKNWAGQKQAPPPKPAPQAAMPPPPGAAPAPTMNTPRTGAAAA